MSSVLLVMAGCSFLAPLDALTSGPLATQDAASGNDGGPPPAEASGDDASSDGASELPAPPATGFSRSITIRNAGTADLPSGYAVSFALDTASLIAAGKLRSDDADLRIVDPGGAQLDRVVDGGSPSTVWFATSRAIPAQGSDTYTLRYGAPDAGAAPANPHAVFVFWDDFAGGKLDPRWIVNGSPVLGNGTVTLRAGQQDALTTNASTDSIPTLDALEIVARITDPSSAAQTTPSGNFYYWFGFQHTGDFTPSEPWIVWIARDAGVVWAEQSISGSPSCSGICQPPTALPQDTSYHSYVVERAPGATRFVRDGVPYFTVSDPTTTDYSPMLRNWSLTSDLVVKLVRARPLVDPEPGVTLGPEQASP